MKITPKSSSFIIAALSACAAVAVFFAVPAFAPRAHAAAIGSYTKLSGSSGSSQPNTVATDGTHVWILNNNGTVSEWGRYTLMATYPTSSTKMTTGLSILFDGTNLWVAGYAGTSGVLTELSTNGTELQTINLGASKFYSYGLAYDGTNVWIAGDDRSVTKVSPTGTILFSTTTTMLPQLQNIAFDGTDIWVTGYGNKAFRFSTSGTLVGSTTLSASATFDANDGLAWDGTNMWIGGQDYMTSDGLIDQVSASGTLLQSVTGTIPKVMAFDGTNTWISGVDRTSLAAEILQVTPAGTITKYSSAGGGGSMYVSSTKTLWASNTTVTQTTNTMPGDSSLSALSGSFLSISPSFPSATTSYTMSVLENATSVTLTATTTDPLAGMLIESTATTTANGVPDTISFSSGAFAMDGNSEYIKVYAEDYSSATYYFHIAATSTPDSALTFSSSNDAVSCPAGSPMHCTLTATSTQTPIPWDFTPTLAVPGGSITINGTPWTSGTDYTGTSTVTSFTSLTINVTGADNSTSTYNLSISVSYPPLTGEGDYGSFSQWNTLGLTTMGSNAWADDNRGNLYEITPSGTVTEYPYGGTDQNPTPFGLASDGTNIWMVGNAYPTSGIIRYTPGTNTWQTFDPPATGFSNDGDGYYGVAVDKFGNVWAVNWDDSSLVELSPTGTYIGNFPNATTTNFLETYNAIAYDGTNMWTYIGIRSNEQLTEISPTGTVLNALHIPGCYPSGMTFDGTNIWTLDMCGTATEVSPGGTILKTYSTPSTGGGGITFDGTNVWVEGQYATEITPSGDTNTYGLNNNGIMSAAYSASTDMLWGSDGIVTTFSPHQPGSAPAATTYSITVTQGSNGTISPGTQTGISSGGSQTFTIAPDSGYAIASLTVDGSVVAAANSYTFSNITANHTITAAFSAAPAPVVVSVASGGGGGGGGSIPPGKSNSNSNSNSGSNQNTSTSTASTTSNPTSTLPIVSTSTPSTASSTASSTTPTLPPLPPVPPIPTTTKKNSKTDAYVFVVNDVLNGYGGTKTAGSFTISVKGKSASPSSFTDKASGMLVAMQPGAYSVTERSVAGYTAAYSTGCTGTAVAGQEAVCVIVTAQLPPPHLTVIADVMNSYFGTATSSDLSVKVSGTQVVPSSFTGSASGVSVSLASGRYSVSAKAPAGYVLTYSSDCRGSVTYGEAPVCTVTASDPPVAELLVNEVVLNNFGGTKTAGSFTVSVKGTHPSPSTFAGSAAGTSVIMKPGDYSVSQKAVAGYSVAFTSGCSGSIVAGEIVTCNVVTTDLQPPLLTVYAGVVNGYGGTATPASLALSVKGTKVSPSAFAGSAAGTLVSLSSGSYSVSAKSPAGYALGYSGCSGTVTYGSNPVCSVTATQTEPKGWIPPVATSTTPTSTVPTTPTSTPIISTSTLPTTPTSTTPTSTITSTSTITIPTSTISIPTSTVPTLTQPLVPTSTITVNNGAPVVTTTTVTITLPQTITSGGGTVSIVNNGGSAFGPIPVPAGPYPWTLTPGDGVKTITLIYQAPNSSSTVTSTFNVFLDTSNDIVQQPQLDCSGIYLTGYAFANQPTNPVTVTKIQQFLNKYMGTDLPVNGIYDAATQDAVNQFQVQYSKQILAPWVPFGLPNSTTPTGNTYKTTQRWINILACPGISLPSPVLP